jgi:hypothetical protein
MKTDVPDARTAHDVNRGDTDVSLFVRRYHGHRPVRPPLFSFVTTLTCCRICYSSSGSDSLPRGDRPGSGTKLRSDVHPSSDEMEVNARTANPLEDYLLPQPARYVSLMDTDRLLDEHPRRASSDEEDPEAALQENRHSATHLR